MASLVGGPWRCGAGLEAQDRLWKALELDREKTRLRPQQQPDQRNFPGGSSRGLESTGSFVPRRSEYFLFFCRTHSFEQQQMGDLFLYYVKFCKTPLEE